MRFCLVVPEEFASHYRSMPFEISGLLNWARVLGGDVKRIDEDLSGYDVFMTNISSTEIEYISVLRMLEPDAKIVACFDYGFDVVNQYFTNIDRVREVMSRADRVFSVNRNQMEWMRLMLPDKVVQFVPHPADTENMVKFRRRPDDRDLGVGAMWHQYDNYQLQGLLVLREVEKRTGLRLNKVFLGAKGKFMAEAGVRVLAASTLVADGQDVPAAERGKPIDPYTDKYVQLVPRGIGWDGVMPYVGVTMWYETLARFRACLDLYTVNSIGRFGIDCAGAAVPLVASNRQDSSAVLWPQTTVDPFEPWGAIRAMCRLLTDPEHYARVEAAAAKALQHYGFARSRERMLRVLDE